MNIPSRFTLTISKVDVTIRAPYILECLKMCSKVYIWLKVLIERHEGEV